MRSCSFRELDQPDSAYNRAAAATRQGDPFCCRTEWQFSYHEVRHPRLPLHLWQGGDSVIAFAEHPHFAPGPQLQPRSKFPPVTPWFGAASMRIWSGFANG